MDEDKLLANSNPKNESIAQYEGKYKTVSEYADALRTWMSQVHQMQYALASFPFFLASIQAQASLSSANSSNTTNASGQNNATTTTPPPAATPQSNARNRQEIPMRGIQYTIPPIWKRGVAEAIDFFLLFIIKLGVTYIAVDAFDLLEDVDKYDFETLGTDFLTDYRAALNMTSEILFLELIHRIGTCVFEALCLHRGPGGLGGATPGKRVMGLRVVKCEWVAATQNNQALVYPSSDLGLGRAVVRSVVKNLSLTFLFPVCFTLFSFQNRRTVYDIIAGSIVVDERRPTVRPVVEVNANNNNNNDNIANNNNNFNNVNQNVNA